MKLAIGSLLLIIAIVQAGELDASIRLREDVFEGDSSRILQGYPASPGSFPFAVRLNLTVIAGIRMCGGSLISTRHVLTAAHCLIGSRWMLVQLASVDSQNPGQVVNATKYVYHPQHDPINLTNDMGLVDMEVDVTVSNLIKPILLPRMSQMFESFENRVITIAGWGTMANTGPQSRYLLHASLLTITNAECTQSYGPNVVKNTTLCAVGTESAAQGPCTGDSGGPFFLIDEGEYVQVGVASFTSSRGCDAGYPSGYVQPHHYWPWISEWTGIPIRY